MAHSQPRMEGDILEENAHPAVSARDPDRSPERSASSLCKLCSDNLVLDDAKAGGLLKTSPDGTSNTLYFPEQERQCDRKEKTLPYSYWIGGNDYSRVVTSPDLPELSEPAQKGCRFCAALKSALLDRYGDQEWLTSSTLKIKLTIEYQWEGYERMEKVRENEVDFSLSDLLVTATHPDIDDLNYSSVSQFNFPIVAAEGKCRDWLRIKLYPLDPEGAMSKRSIGMIQRWIEECGRDQTCDKLRDDKNFLPKRLLDLGVANAIPILIETDECRPNPAVGEKKVKYACLSYCWGSKSPPLKTTSRTLSKHKKGIPNEELPQVFSDAIRVARELGLQYLWIDALCILQDDSMDWEQESGTMADVFHHAFIVLGAAAASTCHGTLFPQRIDKKLDLSFKSSVQPDISGKYSIFLCAHSFRGPLEMDLRTSTWDKRGWVWQEQNLAQRLLIFGSEMVHMRCHQLSRSENGSFSFASQQGANSHQILSMSFWNDWMSSFGSQELTHPYDKLAAASGLAKSFQRSLEKKHKVPKYLAGLWLHKEFHQDLRWTYRTKVPSFRGMMEILNGHENYCAPSWSWASRNQGSLKMHIFGYGKKQDFELVDYEMIPAKSDEMVRLKPGSSITVRGKIIQVRHRPSDGVFVPEHQGGRWKVCWSNGQINYWLDWNPDLGYEDDPDVGYEGGPECLLHLFVTVHSDVGIVLYPTERRNDQQYVRVGVFSLVNIPTDDWPVRKFSIV